LPLASNAESPLAAANPQAQQICFSSTEHPREGKEVLLLGSCGGGVLPQEDV